MRKSTEESRDLVLILAFVSEEVTSLSSSCKQGTCQHLKVAHEITIGGIQIYIIFF